MSDDPPLSRLGDALYRHGDVDDLVAVLTTTLAGLVPPDLVRVRRRRTVADRLHGRDGTPVSLSFTARDHELTLRRRADSGADVTDEHVVRGVRLSQTSITVRDWVRRLAERLDEVAAEDEHTRAALYRFLLD